MKADIRIRRHSGIFTLESEQWLPIGLDEAWDFFSTPGNLAGITPAEMLFRITSGEPGRMYAGQIITYRMGIFPLVKSNWVTEITHVEEGSYFVDEQRFGPYSMWHHEHRFEERDGGVMMRDKVSYRLPLGFLGRWGHGLLVKPSLLRIFTYRAEKLDQLFGSPSRQADT